MNKTLKIACTAVMTALSIVANIFTVPIYGSNAISFTIVFCFLTGIYLGIVPAIVVGYVGDLLAHFIMPKGSYNWFIALSALLFGLICALVYKMKCRKIFKLIIATAITFVVCSVFLNTFGLWLNFIVGVDPSPIGLIQFFGMDKGGIKKSFWVYMWGRLPFQAINMAANVIIVGIVQQTKVLDKVIYKLSNNNEAKAINADETADKPDAANENAANETASPSDDNKTE